MSAPPRRRALIAAGLGAAALAPLVPPAARAFGLPAWLSSPRTVRISKGYGLLYLPLLVMERQRLFEAHAARRGLGKVKPEWVLLDGGNSVNDAMMAGTLDFAGAGAPGFIELWARSRGIPNVEVIGISGLSATSLSLNTNQPRIRTLADFTPADRIAVPGIHTSLAAVTLQMIAAQRFGLPRFTKLDPITVNLPHPQAMEALIRRDGGVTAHFASPPFSTLELRQPGIHRVIDAVEVLGPLTLDVVFAPRRVVDAEPGLAAAFIGALDEANRFIAAQPREAAAIYVATSGVRVTPDDVATMLAAPQTRFSVLPDRLMAFVDFLHGVGTIKTRPRRWEDMFTAQLAAYRGR
ncbi:ABC transporter substrate-binding protein [Burkholderia glumae]|uniref:ABC transporter substrate-binding protein n=1 Tax=Burkholderia glumae TaxID=337 RepID=UPI000F5EB310|nr:ABC transporter substrate-binding protein [Burkholderia glumae]RQZ75216.1 ABC transporter substrate-binding protein [Burkholderia glumae]